MKLLHKEISAKDGAGRVTLRCETPQDLWHTFHLLAVDDLLKCAAVRKVVKESTGGTGSVASSVKKKLTLTLRVTKIDDDFDPNLPELRVSGTVAEQVRDGSVRLGAHHTATLQCHENFTIEKPSWDAVFLHRLDEATHPERGAEVAAVVCQLGLAHVCLIAGALTVTKARIERTIPKKRTAGNVHVTATYSSSGGQNKNGAHAKAISKFYHAIYQAMMKHIDFHKVKVILIASPGFVKDDLFQYVQQQAAVDHHRDVETHKQKFVLCKASSGHLHALEEVFATAASQKLMQDTQVAQEAAAWQEFLRLLETDPDRAHYGYAHVHAAHAHHAAVQTLLVADDLFRSSDVRTRRQYVQLVESVQQAGGTVHILSVMHVAGQQLNQVSGVAAILRFPLPDLEELEERAAAHEAAAVAAASGQDEQGEEESDDDHVDTEERRLREDIQDMGLADF